MADEPGQVEPVGWWGDGGLVGDDHVHDEIDTEIAALVGADVDIEVDVVADCVGLLAGDGAGVRGVLKAEEVAEVDRSEPSQLAEGGVERGVLSEEVDVGGGAR
ncbi:MAG: hypothetical protein QM708_02080 [Propioniciclava sp.]